MFKSTQTISRYIRTEGKYRENRGDAIGNYEKKHIQKLKLTIVEEYTNILGITIVFDTTDAANLNFENIVEKLEQNLKLWKNRK